MKSVVKSDQFGIYVESGGWTARPGKTRYKVGATVDSHHMCGTTIVGVGKIASCGRGEYVELWGITGMASSRKNYPEFVLEHEYYTKNYTWDTEWANEARKIRQAGKKRRASNEKV